jgi:7-methyl-GTP pyrophosphatase
MIVFLRCGVKEKTPKKPTHAGTYISSPHCCCSHAFDIEVIILASSSSYRRALLQRLGLPFEVRVPDIDESPHPGDGAERTALRLAEMKARAVRASSGALVIGSDQVADLEGQLLGKPGDHDSAVRQLKLLSGKRVVFHTAICLYNADCKRVQCTNVPTTVAFRDLAEVEIQRYLSREQPYDCAGSAKVEGLGIALVERVASDDPTALIGLPLVQLVTMLRNEGVTIV